MYLKLLVLLLLLLIQVLTEAEKHRLSGNVVRQPVR